MASLSETMNSWYKRIFRELHVSWPGYIKAYDPVTTFAEIQLTIKPEINDEFADPPILGDVPVRQYNTKAALFYAAPAVDDLVDVFFTDFSLAEFQQEDGKKLIEPQDTDRHNINNAYAVPQVQTSKNKHTIADPTMPGIYLAPDSKLFLGRLENDGEEVLTLIQWTTTVVKELIDYMKTTLLIDSNTFLLADAAKPPLLLFELRLNKIIENLDSLGDIQTEPPPIP